MTMDQFKRVFNEKTTTIYMSQNFYVVPERDEFTFEDDLIFVRQKDKNGNKTLAFCFDVANVVGVEHLSVKSRY